MCEIIDRSSGLAVHISTRCDEVTSAIACNAVDAAIVAFHDVIDKSILKETYDQSTPFLGLENGP